MEFIHGIDPFEYSKSLPADNFGAIDAFVSLVLKVEPCAVSDQVKVIPQHNNCFLTFIEMHNRGVYHGDIRSSNMKLLEPVDPTNPQYVIFDFNLSGSIEDIQSRGKLWADQEAAGMMDFVAQCNIDHWYGDRANYVWVDRLCDSPYNTRRGARRGQQERPAAS